MVFGTPLALIGLAAVAIPLLVHLLAAARARRVPFPTLRFLPEVLPIAVRARRISDRWLLALRCLIVALAAIALAQPWLVRDDRGTASTPIAVVVDVSDSMARATPEGGTAVEAARRTADQLAAGAHATVIETDDLAAGTNAAAAWLRAASLGGAGEIVVVSDFQRGSLTASDLGNVPDGMGLRWVKVPTSADAEIEMPRLQTADRSWSTTVAATSAATTATWTPGPIDQGVAGPAWRAPEATEDAARAVAAAAGRVVAVSPSAGSPERRITVIWPGAPERESLRRQSTPPSAPWMAGVIASLPALPAWSAADSAGQLLLFVDEQPGSAAALRIMAAVRGADAAFGSLGELEPGFIDEAILRGWERPVAQARRVPGNDGRWLWLMVLGLLVVEHIVRRDPARSTATAPAGTPDAPGDVHVG